MFTLMISALARIPDPWFFIFIGCSMILVSMSALQASESDIKTAKLLNYIKVMVGVLLILMDGYALIKWLF